MAPDLRRKVDATRAARLAREAQMKRQAEAQVRAYVQKILALLFWSTFVFFDLIETVN